MTNANITIQIIVGQIPSSKKQGTTQHTATNPKMNHVELSHIELYLIPPKFSIIFDLCYYADNVTPMLIMTFRKRQFDV